MGQHASVPASTVAPPTVSRQLENFYHVCNIIPDTPQHQKRQWVPAETMNLTVQPNRSSEGHRRRRSNRREPVVSTTDYTTDDESDTYESMRRRHRSKRKHRLRQRSQHVSSNRYNSDTDHSMDDDELLRSSIPTKHPSKPIAPEDHSPIHANHLPLTLDRRFDLDIAPSMVNMNLQWNGAYMVASLLYNEIAVKYGYKHLLSVQQLHWEAVRRYLSLIHI